MGRKILRSFYFYDFELFCHDIVNNKVMPVVDFMKSIFDAFTKISQLKYIENDMYGSDTLIYKTQSSDYLFIIVDNLRDTIDLRIILSRKSLLPYVEEDGALRPLTDFLPSLGAGIAEVTHMVIFPEYKTFGAEFNYFGARPSSICSYIPNKVPEIVMVKTDPKVNLDTLKELREDPELSLFELFVKPNSVLIKELIKEESLLQATDINSNIDSIRIVLKRRITKKKRGFPFPFDVNRCKGILTSNERENINKFVIKDRIHSDTIDLLSDRLVFKESFLPMENTRTLNKETAYSFIKDNFHSTVKHYCSRLD